jgi:transcriptional regulator with XRE-family HTH domain
MDVAKRIKELRKAKGISAEMIAEQLGTNPTTIYRYEKGDIEKMPLSVLEPIAKILGCSPAYLMGWTDDPDPSFAYNFPFFTKKELEKFLSALPPMHLKEVDGVIVDDDSGEDSEGNHSTIKYEDIDKAFEFYEHYKNAIPQIQEAVRNLLKVDESDS